MIGYPSENTPEVRHHTGIKDVGDVEERYTDQNRDEQAAIAEAVEPGNEHFPYTDYIYIYI